MSDATTNTRIEPVIEPAPAADPKVVATAAAPPPPPPASTPAPKPATATERAGLDQLFRIEEKTARIEEKFARSETLLKRVEDVVEASMSKSGEFAKQAELTALRQEVAYVSQQVRRKPGFAALIATAVLAAVLSSTFTIALLSLLPGVIAR
ncbi:hypothetical protein QNA08_08435 [Chelatococcus sp. SYSU_G07232]|uniref:Uncharacterized protein n=1 Tax=Chelatococcus albus TaxID=3047466 RepID=A0ABT7AGX0_9HYPH|nr:hypothetical protein [Chelatococcus sp. SYSU_G07232]MDJ1158257.1 hypothetical protein [Chelatococcus sp. SYSU_G07232]